MIVGPLSGVSLAWQYEDYLPHFSRFYGFLRDNSSTHCHTPSIISTISTIGPPTGRMPDRDGRNQPRGLADVANLREAGDAHE